MAKQFFFFERETTVKQLDKDGNPIPETVTVEKEENGEKVQVEEPVPGRFKTEKRIVIDTLNLNKVIRTHTLENGTIIVLLDDGHEETQKNPVLKNPGKSGPITKKDIIEEKSRVWVQSEILILKSQAEEFYKALGEVEI